MIFSDRIFANEIHKSIPIRSKIRLGDVHLKKMGEDLKLPFNLHFHLIHNTFSNSVLMNSIRIEYVSKLLDPSSIQQTQMYAKIVSKELDKAEDKYIN